MTGGPDTLFPPGLDSTLYGSLGVEYQDDEFHATQHRRVEQAMLELQKAAQLPFYDWTVIWDGGSNYVGRNGRTAEAVYTGSALHSVYGSVRDYMAGLAIPGGRLRIEKMGSTNAEIPVLNTLKGCDGMHLYMAGYGKRGQAPPGHAADTNVILKVPNSGHSFSLGANTGVLDFLGAGPDWGYQNFVIDGVSVDANNRVDVALIFKGIGTANGSTVFRSNFRGGAVDVVQVGPAGDASVDVAILACQIGFNGTGNGERSLLAILAGDMMMAYNNIACPAGNANAIYQADNLWSFGCHVGGGSSTKAAWKIVGGSMTSILGHYIDNQVDTVHGAIWVVPSSPTAIKVLNILYNRLNANAGIPFVVFDGTSSGAARGVSFANVIGNWSKGDPAGMTAIVKFINSFSQREAVSIESNQFLCLGGPDIVVNPTKVWTSDGTGSGVPWTWGNKVHANAGYPYSTGFRGENFLTGTLNGAGPLVIPHRLYAQPEIVVPAANKVGALPVGRISAYADATNVYVISSSSETSLPISVIVKVIGS